jgi:DNA-binding MarR family transcriptional regulator
MGDSAELAEDLRSAIGRLVRTVREVDTLASGEAAVLGLVDREGPQTTAAVAQRRGVRHQSVAKSVKELVAEGLLSTEAHPTDGRKLLLHLTPAGRDRLDDERRSRADKLAVAIDEDLTAAERQDLERCVALLSRLAGYVQGNG